MARHYSMIRHGNICLTLACAFLFRTPGVRRPVGGSYGYGFQGGLNGGLGYGGYSGYGGYGGMGGYGSLGSYGSPFGGELSLTNDRSY